MDNKSFSLVLGVLVVAGLLCGAAFYAGRSSAPQPVASVCHGKPSQCLGTATAAQALDQQALLTELNNINTDAVAVRAPLAAILSTTTAAIDFPNLTTSTLAQSTTTNIGVAAALGDFVIVKPNTPTAGVYFMGEVTTASTTAATVTISEQLNAFAAADATSTTFNVLVLPKSTFVAPAALTQ